MKTTDLSRVLTSKPVNKTAGLVMSRGIHFDDTKAIKNHGNHFHAEAPPRVLPKHMHPKSEGFIDYTGEKLGRLTVIGLMPPEASTGTGAKWLVRCACGDYEFRTAKAIRRQGAPHHTEEQCCEECNYNRKLKLGYVAK